MDPITHTFVGAGLSTTGLGRKTALALPTLLIAANAPDVDIVAMAGGPWAALAWRRGITHGLPALVVLPFLVAGASLLWDRTIRRRRDPGRPPARPAALLGLAFLGVCTHPVLDWLNTYGMRWLLPFEGGWTYGDAVFIVDPWLWLLLGGPLYVAWSGTSHARAAWGAVAGLLSLVVLAAPGVPLWARVLWLAGVAAWVGVGRRVRRGPVGEADRGAEMISRVERVGRARRVERLTRGSMAVAALYIVAMIGQTHLAEGVVLREAEARGEVAEASAVMAGPAPADPFERQVVLETTDAYHTGTFRWTRAPRVRWDPRAIPRRPRDEVVAAAESHPEARRYLAWARFPFHRVTARESGWWVTIHDARYAGRDAGGLGGVGVLVDPDLVPVHAGPPDAVPPEEGTGQGGP